MNTNITNRKSILITGANGGLGLETTKFLVQDGFERVVMACRSASRGLEAKKEVMKFIPSGSNTSVEVIGGFDMNDPAQIIAAVDSLPADEKFDTIFLGAGGVIFSDDYQTVEWNNLSIEKTIFQNVLGGHIVMSQLKKRNLLSTGARIVYAGGEGARGIPGMIEKPNFSSPIELRNYILGDFKEHQKYNPMNAIGVSKLVGALWCKKMAQIEDGNLDIIWFSPGLTYGTSGLSGMPSAKRWFMKNIGFRIAMFLGMAQSPKDGARKFADCIEGKIGKNGEVIGAPENKTLGELIDQTPMNDAFSNEELRETFWEILEEVYQPSYS